MLRLVAIVAVFANISLVPVSSQGKSRELPAPYNTYYSAKVVAMSFPGIKDEKQDKFAVNEVNDNSGISLYGVFDGHRGSLSATYAADYLLGRLKTKITQIKHNISQGLQAEYTVDRVINYDEFFKNEIKAFDEALMTDLQNYKEDGTTAIVAIIDGETIHVANVGDSRAVMGTLNGDAIALSEDHKPDTEFDRIKEAGGNVWTEGNRNIPRMGRNPIWSLSTSRVLGDRSFKEDNLGLIATPETVSKNLSQSKFIILASDGVWVVFDNEQAVTLINNNIGSDTFGVEQLATQARNSKSGDDITIMVIKT